jgi:hypothetical protein
VAESSLQLLFNFCGLPDQEMISRICKHQETHPLPYASLPYAALAAKCRHMLVRRLGDHAAVAASLADRMHSMTGGDVGDAHPAAANARLKHHAWDDPSCFCRESRLQPASNQQQQQQ